MREGGIVLALDLATAFGWAEGAPGETPRVGSGRFASGGSSHAAVGAGALQWFADRLAIPPKPAVVFVERIGLHSIAGGKSSFDVVYRLLGLAFMLETIAYRRGVYDVRFAKAEDVRLHFVGTKNAKGDAGKLLTQRRCDALGWTWRNPDEADALALWDYGVEQVAPGAGHEAPAGLFKASAAPKVRKPRNARIIPGDKISAKQARELGLFDKLGRSK